jgi:hypothetical protein
MENVMFHHTLWVGVGAWIVAFAVGVPTASAEPLTIARGFFSLGGTFGVDLGFYTTSTRPGDPAPFVGEGTGHSPAGLAEFFSSPPRTMPALHAVFSPAEVMDPSSNSSCPGCGYGGDFRFLISPMAIPAEGEVIQTSFSMSGTFDGFAPGTNAQVFHLDVAGSGTARISRDFVGFDFATPASPTPEPASALLLISGVAFLARRAARRSRSPDL